jgi:CRP-like cAMP-binding protein
VTVTSQAQLLSSAKLRINDRLSRARPEPDAVVLRAAGGDRRLVVSPEHARILTESFAEFRSVPEVLVRTIAEGRCPPLREFYELVVQAHAAGVLQTEPSPAEPSDAIRWPVRLAARLAMPAASGGALVSLGFLAFTIPQWRGPETDLEVVGGWLLACALLSLGALAAACVIATCGEVRAIGLHWRTRFPHFRIDTSEAIVGGRDCEAAVGAVRALPVLVGAALAAWRAPGWLPALCGGSLFILAPFGHSAARQWLAARRTAPHYSIRADFIFEPAREDLWARGAARLHTFVAEFGWLGLGWALVWGAWSLVAFTHCMPKTAAAIVARVRGAPPPVHLGAEYLLLGALALGLLVWAWAGVKHWLLVRARAQPLRGADAREPRRPPLSGNRTEMLAQAPLFARLNPESRAAIAEAMEWVECARGAEVTREDDPGDDFFLIVDGELEVRKRLPAKRRSATIGWLGPGDCFGEIALLENTTRTATLIASRPTRLLRLGRADFERLIVGRLGAAPIRELLQHARFLGRLTFTAGWSFADLVKLAQRCRTVRAEVNQAPIVQGETNLWFYLIYDGAFEAREGARVLRRMGPGDYFGEISLLEGWPATATVVAIEESRCLALSRTDFLELFARDFRLGLRLEAIAERRRGGKIFVSR